MAVAFSNEQFEKFLAEIVGSLARSTPVGHGDNPNKRTLRDKGFSRVNKFAQGENVWLEWSFDFKTALGSQSVELKEYLDVVEKQAEIVTQQKAVEFDQERAKRVNFIKLNSELYEILVIMTEGEAKMMVKATTAGDGVQAWSKLHKHNNKRTVARLI